MVERSTSAKVLNVGVEELGEAACGKMELRGTWGTTVDFTVYGYAARWAPVCPCVNQTRWRALTRRNSIRQKLFDLQ